MTNRCRALACCFFLSSCLLFSGSASAQAYPNIAGPYTVTETYTITVSALGDSETDTGSGSNPVTVTQSGNVFAMTARDPSSGISLSLTGTLSGNMITSISGPAFGFRNVSGLTVNRNQITSGSGLVEVNRITLHATGVADIVVTGEAADVVGVPSGTAVHFDLTATLVLSGNVTPVGVVIPPSGCTATANGSTANLVQLAANSSLTLSVAGCSAGTQPFTFQWKQGATVIGNTQTVSTVAASSATTTTYTGTISNSAGSSTVTVNVQTSVAQSAANYEGLWWRSPAGSESGWGINFAHQGDVIFATFFTYDLSGKAWWLSMTANKAAANPDTYIGQLVETRGPPFNSMPFNPAAVSASAVGTGTLTFISANNGTFAYTINGVTQTKAITRQVFATLPTCTFGALSDLTRATNYQDLWWAAPPGAESGWGVNLTHQSDTIFATWFTYDFDGKPLWLSATLPKTAPAVYSGALIRTTGPAFNSVPFLPASVVPEQVGTLTISFTNGNNGVFAYTVALPGRPSVSQMKQITRQVFRSPGTVCQ